MTAATAGAALAWAYVLGLLGLGATACAIPGALSGLYGVPTEGSGLPWVRAAGLRDVGLGAALTGCLLADQPVGAAAICLATAGIAVTDALNVVLTRRAAPPLPLAVHASGVAVGAIAGALLLG